MALVSVPLGRFRLFLSGGSASWGVGVLGSTRVHRSPLCVSSPSCIWKKQQQDELEIKAVLSQPEEKGTHWLLTALCLARPKPLTSSSSRTVNCWSLPTTVLHGLIPMAECPIPVSSLDSLTPLSTRNTGRAETCFEQTGL